LNDLLKFSNLVGRLFQRLLTLGTNADLFLQGNIQLTFKHLDIGRSNLEVALEFRFLLLRTFDGIFTFPLNLCSIGKSILEFTTECRVLSFKHFYSGSVATRGGITISEIAAEFSVLTFQDLNIGHSILEVALEFRFLLLRTGDGIFTFPCKHFELGNSIVKLAAEFRVLFLQTFNFGILRIILHQSL